MLQFFIVFQDSSGCRSDDNTYSARLSVTWKIQREASAKPIRQYNIFPTFWNYTQT